MTRKEILNADVELTHVDDMQPHPSNPRDGDIDIIKESIEENGFYGTILANRRTGNILAGNHRYMAAVSLGFEELPVAWVDVDATHAKKILLSDNRTSDVAEYNTEVLNEILKELNDDLKGTGYTEETAHEIDRFDNLLESIENETTDRIDNERLGQGKQKIRPAMYIDGIKVFERAVTATGNMNRAEAIIEVCEFYLNAKDESPDSDSGSGSQPVSHNKREKSEYIE